MALSGGQVSVVIPAYKAAKTVARAVQSVLDQTTPAREILVIDDGSPDDIAGALASFGPPVTVIRKPNGGASSARNLGIDRSTGDFVSFLDADDYWSPDKLEKQLAIFAKHPEVGLLSGTLYLQQEGGGERTVHWVRQAPFDQVIKLTGPAAFAGAGSFWTGTVMVRREVLGELRFDETLSTAEDRDLWLRILLRTSGYLMSEPLATLVLVPGSLSRTNIERDIRNMLRVIDRYRDLLGEKAYAKQVADTHAKWCSRLLTEGDGRGALRPAFIRLRHAPSPTAMWIMAKSAMLAAVQPTTGTPPRPTVAGRVRAVVEARLRGS